MKSFLPNEVYSDRNSTLNVVLVDWIPLATGGLGNYGNIAKNTGPVGVMVAESLLSFQEAGAIKNWDTLHIIGFSLGAHIAGIVGDQIWRKTGRIVQRITGRASIVSSISTFDMSKRW